MILLYDRYAFDRLVLAKDLDHGSYRDSTLKE
jgi:hypothetical protein